MQDDWDGLDLSIPKIRSLLCKSLPRALVDARPLKELGFDPILKMPDFDTFAAAVVKRKVIHCAGYNLMQGTD
jgi:hypothetical protein